MSDLHWYACVYESEGRIIFGRAPTGDPDAILEGIKHDLVYHDLIGLQSKVFLRRRRLAPEKICEFCERKADRNVGDYRDFKVVKLDLR